MSKFDENPFGKKEQHRAKPDFPNYLSQQRKADSSKEDYPAAYRSSSYHVPDFSESQANIPFLQVEKQAFSHTRKIRPSSTKETLFHTEKKRFEMEKRAARRDELGLKNYAFYKTRRPFRVSEVPSLAKDEKVEKEQKINYHKIAEDLTIAQDQLLLFDLDPPAEETVQPEQETIKDHDSGIEKPNKALHRSLSGIMEQERSRLHGRITSQKTTPPKTGYHSYFKK